MSHFFAYLQIGDRIYIYIIIQSEHLDSFIAVNQFICPTIGAYVPSFVAAYRQYVRLAATFDTLIQIDPDAQIVEHLEFQYVRYDHRILSFFDLQNGRLQYGIYMLIIVLLCRLMR